jgi:hypothetical protein
MRPDHIEIMCICHFFTSPALSVSGNRSRSPRAHTVLLSALSHLPLSSGPYFGRLPDRKEYGKALPLLSPCGLPLCRPLHYATSDIPDALRSRLHSVCRLKNPANTNLILLSLAGLRIGVKYPGACCRADNDGYSGATTRIRRKYLSCPRPTSCFCFLLFDAPTFLSTIKGNSGHYHEATSLI